jgi:hypothetical protein
MMMMMMMMLMMMMMTTKNWLVMVPINVFFLPMALQLNAGHDLLILDEVSRSHTTTHHSQ